MSAWPTDWLRPLGRTDLTVSAVCAGGGPLGSMPDNFGYHVPAERGIDTVTRVLRSPINFLDTSNGYSGGESERRIGAAVAAAGGLPDGFVLATKVDRDRNGDFSGPRVRRSIEESLARLGMDQVPLLYLHDPEHITFEEGMAPGGPVEELARIRDEGLARYLGVAGGPVGLLRDYVGTGAFDAVLTHNRYTLVDRSAEPLLQAASAAGVAVVNAAIYGGGILATGVAGSDKYGYRAAPPAVLRSVAAIEKACAASGVPLPAAALRFSMRDPRIASTVIGISRPERVDECLSHVTWDIPDELWAEIDRNMPAAEYWLN
jgi:D-threo-aldose 1-dehydrogenase